MVHDSSGYSLTRCSGLTFLGSVTAGTELHLLLRFPVGGGLTAIFLFLERSDGFGAFSLSSKETDDPSVSLSLVVVVLAMVILELQAAALSAMF